MFGFGKGNSATMRTAHKRLTCLCVCVCSLTGGTKRLVAPTPQISPIVACDLAFQLDDSNFWLESITFLLFSRDGSFTTVSFAVVIHYLLCAFNAYACHVSIRNYFFQASLPFNKHQVLFTIKWHDADCKEHSFQNKYKIGREVRQCQNF